MIILLVAGCTFGTHEFAGTVIEESEPVPDFTLIGDGDEPVSLGDYTGKYVFLYFGYSFCPDVCPATLSELKQVRRELGEDADMVQVIMVTVDPERDTPDTLKGYVSHFDPTFIGLSGDKEEIDAVGKIYGLFYEKHEGTAASGYLVDHTARAYLIGPERYLRVVYPFDTRSEAIVADLRWLFAHD